MSLVAIRGVAKRYADKQVLDGVSLAIDPRDRVGLIGPNGAGKSTLISILLGHQEPDDGEILRRRHLTVAHVSQFPKIDESLSVGEAMAAQVHGTQEVRTELEEVEKRMAAAGSDELDALLQRQSELTELLEVSGGYNVEHVAEAALTNLNLPDRTRKVSQLSQGELRRLALAVALVEPRDLLVLDEPTNHLDVEGVEWLEQTLSRYPGAVLMVSHDRFLLDRVVTKLAEIDRGDLRVYDGNYTEYLVARAERYAIEAKAEERRQKQISHELTWARANAPARTTKQKARLDRLDDLMANNPKKASGDANLVIPHPERIGKTILELEDLGHGYDGHDLFSALSLIMKRGDRIGIVGHNGAGKTTLLKIIRGEIEARHGKVLLGQNTKIVYADQKRAALDPSKTVLENVAGDGDHVTIGERRVTVQSFLSGLLFDGAQQKTKVAALSGGEKSRVALAMSLRNAGNLLILDEPTNDLDLFTLRVLEEAIARYPGCALVVSHDRYFLDRVVTAILAFEDGKVTLYEGDYSSWRKKKQKLVAPKAKAKKETRPAQPKKKTKRSFNEEREYAGMEERIMEAEAKVEELEAILNDPDKIRELGSKVTAKVEALEAAKKNVETLYARWEELGALG